VGLGTGVLVDAAGTVLTAFHVIDGAQSVELRFADGATTTGSVLATQPENDIAVLAAEQVPEGALPATLGNPDMLPVGSEAYVVGNPSGLVGSMSAGIISGFERSFVLPATGRRLTGLIQIDTAVNPGNSGGPLLNRAGHVIGIVTALLNPSGADAFAGIGFAVPIDTAGGAAGLPPY
jgi:S1-C subfamily serine protease